MTDKELKDMAEDLHDRLCSREHSSYCGWHYYPKDDWNPNVKQYWLSEAKEIYRSYVKPLEQEIEELKDDLSEAYRER